VRTLTKEQLAAIAEYSFAAEIESLQATKEVFGAEAFYAAVYALASAERIAASGCGHSGIACMHFAHSLCCIDKTARFLPPSEALHGGLGFLKENDVMVLASRGGKTDELMPIVRACKKKGAKIMSVTENLSSPLAESSDIVLPMKITAESDRHNSQGTSSFVSLCAVFDALQAALIEALDYKNESFAINHPHGAVGKRLNEK
jgi:D-arabinose 5-phosphate isomerase GutQ